MYRGVLVVKISECSQHLQLAGYMGRGLTRLFSL